MTNFNTSDATGLTRYDDFWSSSLLQANLRGHDDDLQKAFKTEYGDFIAHLRQLTDGLVSGALTQQRVPQPNEIAELRAGSDDEDTFAKLCGFFTNCRPTAFVACETSDAAPDVAAQYGLEVSALQAVIAPLAETNVIYHSLYGQLSEIRYPADYHRSILNNGSFSVTSPYSGKSVTSNASFAVKSTVPERPVVVFYLFYDEGRPFFTISERLYGVVVAMFLVNEDVVISATRKLRIKQGDISQLKASIVMRPDDTNQYVNSGDTRRVALFSGMLNHFGHTVLNELDACHQCATAGEFANVDVLFRGWARFFDYQLLYPELAGAKCVEVQSTLDIHDAITRENVIGLRPLCRSFSFSTGLRERFSAVAHNSKSIAAIEPQLEEARACSPVLWFDIRTHDRSWKHQAEGLVSIANKLAEEYPSLGVIIAGWSVFEDHDSERKEGEVVEADQAVADEIERDISKSVKVFNIVGCTSPQKVAWGNIADIFLGVYGSGILFPAAISRKPGVLFSSLHFQKQIVYKMRDGKMPYIQDGQQNYFMPLASITEIPGLGRASDSFFDLDLSVLEKGVRHLLAKLEP